MKTRMLLLPAFLLVLISCKDHLPSGVLPPEKMQAVLWDVMRADVLTTEHIKKDSSRNAVEENILLQKKIFALYHISKEDFYKSYSYYNMHTELMKALLDTIIIRANRNRNNKLTPQFKLTNPS